MQRWELPVSYPYHDWHHSSKQFHGTNAYVLKVVETNQLRCILLDFENEQGKRVEEIVKKHHDAGTRAKEARLASAANAVKKGMPIEEYNFMKWEVDTDVGGVKELKDAFDEGEHIRTAIGAWALTRLLLAIAKAEEELEELSDRFTYEAMLHSTLAAKMKTFSYIAKLPKHEAALWVPRNNDKESERVFRQTEKPELKKCKDDAFAWMKAAVVYYIEHEGASQLVSVNGGGTHDEGTTYEDQKGATNNGHDEAGALPQLQTVIETKYCHFCRKWGHVDEYCPQKFPEEEHPNYCDVCDKPGHREEKCWVLHPELRKQWLADQREKQNKMACHKCGRVGHMRRFCYKLHGWNKSARLELLRW
jgi:hypothetical protein